MSCYGCASAQTKSLFLSQIGEFSANWLLLVHFIISTVEITEPFPGVPDGNDPCTDDSDCNVLSRASA